MVAASAAAGVASSSLPTPNTFLAVSTTLLVALLTASLTVLYKPAKPPTFSSVAAAGASASATTGTWSASAETVAVIGAVSASSSPPKPTRSLTFSTISPAFSRASPTNSPTSSRASSTNSPTSSRTSPAMSRTFSTTLLPKPWSWFSDSCSALVFCAASVIRSASIV